MKKFENKLGEYVYEYTYMAMDGVTPAKAYERPDEYPYFRRMCDILITGPRPGDAHDLDESELMYRVIGRKVYNICAYRPDVWGAMRNYACKAIEFVKKREQQ